MASDERDKTQSESEADRQHRLDLKRQRRDEFRRWLATLPRVSDSTDLIREDRDRDHR
jgi:hypothetical protein